MCHIDDSISILFLIAYEFIVKAWLPTREVRCLIHHSSRSGDAGVPAAKEATGIARAVFFKRFYKITKPLWACLQNYVYMIGKNAKGMNFSFMQPLGNKKISYEELWHSRCCAPRRAPLRVCRYVKNSMLCVMTLSHGVIMQVYQLEISIFLLVFFVDSKNFPFCKRK